VPVLSVLLFRNRTAAGVEHPVGRFERFRDRYVRWCAAGLRRPLLIVAVAAVAAVAMLVPALRIRTELFPRVDAGQMQIRIRGPAGTRLERTEETVHRTEAILREEAGAQFVQLTLANIGNPPWSYPVNGVFVWNSGPQEALLLASLKPGKRPSIAALEARLRQRLAAEMPETHFSFEAGDIVSQVLNFGAPTPINVTVSGNKLAETRAYTEKLAGELRRSPSLRDVQIPQALDYPSVDIKIDRERAGQLGVTVDRIGRSVVAATSSSTLVNPNFWVAPATGVPYRVAIRVPENQIDSLEALRNLPIMPDGAPRPLLADVASVASGVTPGELDHLNSQRMLSVTANVAGGDLARAGREVAAALRRTGEVPRGATVSIRGQVEQMQKTLDSLKQGLLLAVLVVLLLLTANFQSVRDALVVMSTAPVVLGGVAMVLLATGTTLNVESLMGAIMAIGVSVANALLLVTFARDRRQAGDSPVDAALAAAGSRLRPVLMTTLAMIAGMIPMALGWGEGGEQTAPLGRAVIGGLLASLLATLGMLPAMYALGTRKGAWRSPSLAPEGPADGAPRVPAPEGWVQ
jgi:multidrug efflux pump subunit AcrB